MPDIDAAYDQESYMNIKLNDPSEHEENTAGFIEEDFMYYNRGSGTENHSAKGDKS